MSEEDEFVPEEEEEGSVTQGDGLMAAKARNRRGGGGAQALRIVATDLDGTFLDGAGRISARSRELVATLAERGITFAIATGRPAAALQPLVDDLGVPSLPVIMFNGACLQHCSPRAAPTLVWEQPLTSALAKEVVQLIDSAGLPLVYFTRIASVGLAKSSAHRTRLASVRIAPDLRPTVCPPCRVPPAHFAACPPCFGGSGVGDGWWALWTPSLAHLNPPPTPAPAQPTTPPAHPTTPPSPRS